MFSLAIISIVGGLALIVYAAGCGEHWTPEVQPAARRLMAAGAGLSGTGLVALAILVVGWFETLFWLVFFGGLYWFGARVCAPWESERNGE